MLSYIFGIMCGLLNGSETMETVHVLFVICLYLYFHWKSNCKEGAFFFVIPLNRLNPPQICICACLKQGPGFPTPYVMVFFVFS